jgi:hypothetical protein
MDRERYTALDQLAPGDRIWLDGAWRIVHAAVTTEQGDAWVETTDHRGFTAPAALLVRRAET